MIAIEAPVIRRHLPRKSMRMEVAAPHSDLAGVRAQSRSSKEAPKQCRKSVLVGVLGARFSDVKFSGSELPFSQDFPLVLRNHSKIARHVCRSSGSVFLRSGFCGGEKGAISLDELSSMWGFNGVGRLAEIRSRDLRRDKYFGLAFASIVLENALTVEVVLGLEVDGSKKILDFSMRSCNCHDVSKELIYRILERGFCVEGRLFCILDGSVSPEIAVLERWPDTIIQRCLCHEERDILKRLHRCDQGRFHHLMRRLRLAQGAENGCRALKSILNFLKDKDVMAHGRLCEADEKLIALHLLDVPNALNQSLLSNMMLEKIVRDRWYFIGRANNWNLEAEITLIEQWLAAGLLAAERKLNKIKGFRYLPFLFDALSTFGFEEKNDGLSEEAWLVKSKIYCPA